MHKHLKRRWQSADNMQQNGQEYHRDPWNDNSNIGKSNIMTEHYT